MKKLAVLTIILVVMLGLVVASVYATGAKKVQLEQWAPATGEEDASGWAIINYTPPDEESAVGVTDQVQVSGLLPNHSYVYKSHGVILATFTTNSEGKGHCHANLSEDEELDPNWEVNIRDADDNHLVLCYRGY
jgi:hypothetical protein